MAAPQSNTTDSWWTTETKTIDTDLDVLQKWSVRAYYATMQEKPLRNVELSQDPADKKPNSVNYLKKGNKNKIEGVTQIDRRLCVKTELCADFVWYNLTFISENIENVNV